MAKAKAKTESSKKNGLKVSPTQAREAIAVLEAYVAERTKLAEDKNKLGSVTNAVRMMDALYTFKEELAERVKSPAEKTYDMLRFAVVPEMMDGEELTAVTVEGIGRVNLKDDIQVKQENKDALYAWLREEGLEDLIQPTVNAQTLAASVRQRMKEGKSLPEANILKITPIVRAQITR